MTYRFHPDAYEEFLRAIEYYEECQPGLGLDFADEMYDAIQRILFFPAAWTLISMNARRCLINRFPFGIIYSVERAEIIILAVMQLKRKPGYWRKRGGK